MSELLSNCEGMRRRDFIQLGVGALGFSQILQLRAETAKARGKASPEDIRCIMVWLDGGPSHYETFDPKPDAPREIRGDLSPIKTSVPGVHFCETVPHLAKVADKLTIVRSICHKDPNHGGGNHYMMTGAPTPVPVACGAFVTFHPSFGSVISHHRGIRKGLPAYMSMPEMSRSGGPNFLGAEHAPFVIGGYPNSPSFRVRDVVLPKAISEERAKSRWELRGTLDRMVRFHDKQAEDPSIGFDSYYGQGVNLVTSSEAQAAFDISQEPEAVREKYGRNDIAQRMLMARRLVEVGVSFVTVYSGGWDHHVNIFTGIKGPLAPLEKGLAALIDDLDERGLLDSTLVICLGEFGRTPKVNKDAGRDHWPHAMSVLFAGAGVPRGTVVGATDGTGSYAVENVYAPEDFAATLYTKMGIDPTELLHTNTGRPVQLVNNGKLIKELFA